jgi:hypothetical protein
MEDKSGQQLMTLKPNHRNIFHPVNADVLSTVPEFWRPEIMNQFHYKVIGMMEYGGERCTKVLFHQNDNLAISLQSGILYIGKTSGALRYAAWNTSPYKRKDVSYTNFLQANPLQYDVQLTDDYNQVSYSFLKGKLYLKGTNRQLKILVNGQNYLEINNRLSITGISEKHFKDLTNKNADMLIEERKSQHFQVKDPVYQVDPWINLGLVKPEKKLLRDAGFLHDINLYH